MPKITNFIRILLVSFIAWNCSSDENTEVQIFEKTINDTMVIALQTGTSSCFVFEDDTLGYDFELVEQFAAYTQVPFKIVLVNSQPEALQMLKGGEIHLFASQTFESRSLKKEFDFKLFPNDAAMVLVQNPGVKSINNLLELKGKTVTVTENSPYYHRLTQLNEEIGGGIVIETIADSVSSEELIVKLGQRKINFTIAHRNQVNLYKRHFKSLDARLNITFKQKSGWLSVNNTKIDTLFSNWKQTDNFEESIQYLQLKYSRINPFLPTGKLKIPKGAISPYDGYFKKYAKEIGWDWRLIAAIAYHESGFDSTRVSSVGAAGLMQLMPATARSFGLDPYSVFEAEKNIEAGVQYIKSLNLLFRKVLSADDKVKFVLASYNSGPAHVIDAMSLAEKFGKNKYKWTDNVEYYFQRKNVPEYYNDDVVRYGKFNSAQTLRYLNDVHETHLKYVEQSPNKIK